MTRRGRNVVPFSRDHRRARKFDMGLPPGRRPRRPANPATYLKAVIVAAGMGIVFLPAVVDAVNAFARRVPAGQACRVVRVIDGDTVTLWCPARGAERARLDGFDAPELFSPSCVSELAAAWRAKWQLRWLIWTADEVGTVRTGTDRYGRALVDLFVGGQNVARPMIAGGYARPYGGGRREGWCA